MTFISSTALIVSAFLGLVVLGFGVSYVLVPERYRLYVPLISPTAGFALLCLLSIALSGNLGLSMRLSTIIAAVVLTVTTATVAGVRWSDVARLRSSWLTLASLTGFMLAFAFWPVLHQGVDLYLGTSNPDFYQSLSFVEALMRHNLPFFVPINNVRFFSEDPFTNYFPWELQARFGGVTYAVLLDLLTAAGGRTSLMATIVACVLCLPSAVYFFTSAMLRMDHRTACIAGVLIGISAPISMSILHVFVGQNSSLALLPLCMTLLYLALKDLDWKLVALCTLIINAMVFIYVLMLPYILAPLGIYALYRFGKGGARYLARFMGAIAILAGGIALAHAGMLQQSIQFWTDLTRLLGVMAQSHYYVEFLKEDFLVYLTGASSYAMSGSFLAHYLGDWSRTLFVSVAFAVLGLCAFLLQKWQRTADRDSVVAVFSMLAVYVAVWFYYTFVHIYGYASFKMSSWLQFALVPILAFGIAQVIDAMKGSVSIFTRRSPAIAVVTLVSVLYVTSNLFASLDYEWKSYGTDRERGAIVNSFGLGGNPGLAQIGPALRNFTPQGSVVALAFPDSVANQWVAYYGYVVGQSIAVASHWILPDDESYLPDIETGRVQNSMGRYEQNESPFLRDGKADFYLVPGPSNLNVEITDPVKADAVWENGFARLIDASKAKDLVLTGRGFYRLEYFQPDELSWWFPENLRWSGEGGEILHLNPAKPNQPYRLSFVAIVGHGLPQDTRTLEIFHNGKKLDERSVDAVSRIVSVPYYPVPGLNKLVIRVREKTQRMVQASGLWHREIPPDWRILNVGFSEVHISPTGGPSPQSPRSQLDWKGLMEHAVAFNGINLDGWLRRRAEFTLATPPGSGGLAVTFLVPGAAEFSFPFKIKFIVNGHTLEKEFSHPGIQVATLPVVQSSGGGPVRVQIESAQAKTTPGRQGGRDLIQSIHLEQIAFTSSEGMK